MTDSDIEFEGKLLDIDIQEFTKRIKEMGAKFEKKQAFKRYVFDVIPARTGTWLRLRTDGSETTLTIKEINHDGIDGTNEYETNVGDFGTILSILEKSGFKPNGYQENRRTLYRLDKVEISIDEWPLIPPYVEIEGPNKEIVEKTVTSLGFKLSDLTGENTEKVYARYGIDIKTKLELKFVA